MSFILYYISYFFGGMFLANSIPHLVAGLLGRAFQSPFAKPRGEGLSSSRVNVAWGLANALVSYFLIYHVGPFEIHSIPEVLCIFLGFGVLSYLMAGHFGKFHGGNLSKEKSN